MPTGYLSSLFTWNQTWIWVSSVLELTSVVWCQYYMQGVRGPFSCVNLCTIYDRGARPMWRGRGVRRLTTPSGPIYSTQGQPGQSQSTCNTQQGIHLQRYSTSKTVYISLFSLTLINTCTSSVVQVCHGWWINHTWNMNVYWEGRYWYHNTSILE